MGGAGLGRIGTAGERQLVVVPALTREAGQRRPAFQCLPDTISRRRVVTPLAADSGHRHVDAVRD